MPNVEYGEREIDFKYGTWRFDDTQERESAGSLGLGWGATPWWFTEAYFKYHKEAGDRTRYDAFEWENKFQLTETNKYPVDLGLLAEIEIPSAREEGNTSSRWDRSSSSTPARCAGTPTCSSSAPLTR